MADAILEAGAVIDTGQFLTGMESMASSTESATGRMTAAFEGAASASKTIEYSTTEARHAFHGLGEEIGLHIPRFVQSFVANLGGVGPALAAAFTPIAVIGLLQVLGEIPDAFEKIIDKVTGFDSKVKKAYEDASKAAIEFEKQNVELSKKIAEVALIGEKGGQRAALAIDIQKKSTKELGEFAADLLRQINATNQAIEQHISGWRVMANINQAQGPLLLSMWVNQTRSVDELKNHLKDLQAALDQVETKMREAPVEGMRLSAEHREAVKRDAEEEARHRERIAKQEEEENRKRILAELNDDEREAKEKIRIAEESAKINRELSKGIEEDIKKADEELARSQIEALRKVIEERRKEVREQETLAKQAAKPWLDLGRQINAGMDSMLKGVLLGTQGVRQAFARLGTDMLAIVAEMLAKILLKHIAHWVAVHVLEKVGVTQSIATMIAGATAKKGIQTTSNTSSVTSDAGVAGAAAFASVMEALPFPLNVSTAPGVMAESIATTLGNLGLVAARGGMLLSEDKLIAAGAGEAVLPRDLTTGLQRMVAAGGGAGGLGGNLPLAGGHTFNVNFGPVTAMDARGVDAVLRSRADTIVSLIRQSVREYRL